VGRLRYRPSGIFDSGIVGDGYVGGGIEFTTERGFDLRFDFRGSLMPGVDPLFTLEWDAGFGLSFRLGEAARRRRAATKLIVPVNLDADNDGIAGDDDKCPDRAEDADGYEDRDGCPDIDNDLDSVLDIADKCSSVPESYNGFADDDGCPDIVPTEVESVVGTVEGLIYGAQETEVRDSAGPSMDRIAALLAKYPTVRIVLIGHTDETEATPLGTPDPDAPPDIDALSEDLGMARAESVRQALLTRGIPLVRVETRGAGRSETVADNATPRGRLANRRVELKLYVPKR
jgi:OmpA-OmpF porin, OOP family